MTAMFYPPKDAWTRFASDDERLLYYKQWGIVSQKAKEIKPLVYAAPGVDRPMRCTVLGYREPFVAVVDVEGNLSCIHGNFLAETQPDIPLELLGKVPIPQLLEDYVILDLETTGFSREADDIIEISAIRYCYGKKTDQIHYLVNPKCQLPMRIIRLTGITQDMVDSGPEFSEVQQDFLNFLGDSPVVGHNIIRFDVPFLEKHIGRELRNPQVDTMMIAQRVFPGLPSYKLQALAGILEFGSRPAHRATRDVETTHDLLNACLAPYKYRSNIVFKTMKWESSSAKKKREPIVPSVHISEESPMFGKAIVFTGELNISREEAMQIAVNAGATVKGAVSRKTDYLVVGEQDPTIVGEDGMSEKEEKAKEINNSGKGNIKIISENEFLTLAGGVDG